MSAESSGRIRSHHSMWPGAAQSAEVPARARGGRCALCAVVRRRHRRAVRRSRRAARGQIRGRGAARHPAPHRRRRARPGGRHARIPPSPRQRQREFSPAGRWSSSARACSSRSRPEERAHDNAAHTVRCSPLAPARRAHAAPRPPRPRPRSSDPELRAVVAAGNQPGAVLRRPIRFGGLVHADGAEAAPLRQGPARAAARFCARVYCEAHRTGQSVLPPGLVMAVLDVESGFDRWAVSSAGAVGLMQVMPFWPEQLGMRRYELTRITANLHMGCAILRFYLDSERRDVRRALERYNGSIGQRDYPDRVIVRWTHLLARRRRPGAQAAGQDVLKSARQLRRVKLDDLHRHVGHLGGRRSDPQPFDELVHRGVPRRTRVPRPARPSRLRACPAIPAARARCWALAR